MEKFWFFRFCCAYHSACDSDCGFDFWFSLSHKRSYDPAYKSDSVACENQPLKFVFILAKEYQGITQKQTLSFYEVYLHTQFNFLATNFQPSLHKSLTSLGSWLERKDISFVNRELTSEMKTRGVEKINQICFKVELPDS